jgi:glycosyltransferase involved in cell wall biosynthesis
MKKVIVLLSTYNGEKYLQEQLQSLTKQEGVNCEILVRDDGSKDNTTAILDEWQKRGLLKWYSSTNLGCCKSFMDLLKTAEEGVYYAFCDQDDVWLPGKLRLTMEKMTRTEETHPEKPVIIHSDMNVVDENLNIIHESFWKSSGLRPDILKTFPYLCTCNSVNGCTILMNSAARNLILEKYVEQKTIIHDVISALTVAYHGGIIDYITEPTVLYRQHSNNVVGAMHYNKWEAIKERFSNLGRVFRKNIDTYKGANKIGKISIFSYLYHKIKYLTIR